MEPPFPLIIVYKNQMPLIVEAAGELSSAAVIVVLRQQENVAFDRNGEKWSYKLVGSRAISFTSKILAYTFYNPMMEVRAVWTKLGPYPVKELQAVLSHCVDQDDDILTQFIEPEHLKHAIHNAPTFDELYRVLQKYVYQVDAEELERVFPSR